VVGAELEEEEEAVVEVGELQVDAEPEKEVVPVVEE